MNKVVSASFAQLYPLITEAIEKGKSFTFTAFGSSMLPYIRNGKDQVTLSGLSEKPKVGDVIFYRRDNNTFVLHRIIKLEKDFLILCGDNQFTHERVRSSQVIAKLTMIRRNGKPLDPNRFSTRIYVFFLPLRRFCLHVIHFIKRIAKRTLNFS